MRNPNSLLGKPTDVIKKLQRAIAEARGQPPDRALNTESNKSGIDYAARSDDSGAEPRDHVVRGSGASILGTASSSTGTKRKYRRHPKVNTIFHNG
jgi:hypothetical protein